MISRENMLCGPEAYKPKDVLSKDEPEPKSLVRRLASPFKAIARAYEIADKGTIPAEGRDLSREEREAIQWVRSRTDSTL